MRSEMSDVHRDVVVREPRVLAEPRRTRLAHALVPLAAIAVTACGGASASVAPKGAPEQPAAGSASPPVNGAPKSALAVDPSGPLQIECGDFHTCAIMPDHSVRCWGRDKGGQVGDGGGEDKLVPVPVAGVANAESLAISGLYSCAVLADKSVSCWGTGFIANDGAPHVRQRPAPVRGVAGVTDLAASGDMTCSMDAVGAVTCWGLDERAPGMHPDTAGLPVANLEVAATHGCVLQKSGRVRCWGEGDWLPVGNGASLARPSVADALELMTGDAFACVYTKNHDVRCWGRNESGQLGVAPDPDLHDVPVVVPGVTNAPRLAAGESSACVIHDDGSVTCWGGNADGELGLGKKSNDERPRRVPGLANVDALCIGSSHACALTKGHEMLCWGTNTAGQLGDGTREERLTPTRVKF